MNANIYDQIKSAIILKKQVVAKYKGKLREMCPHVIGYKNGRPKALFYQFAGGSNSGLSLDERQRWRDTFVEDVEIIELRSGEWHTGSNHSRPQHAVDQIDVEVAFL